SHDEPPRNDVDGRGTAGLGARPQWHRCFRRRLHPPVMQDRCRGGRGAPGPAVNSVPSSIRIASRPLTWYWKCGASQLAVPAIGWTSLDQRQPGSKTSRPTSPPPILRISARPLGNSRVSSGAWKLRCSVLSITVSVLTAHGRNAVSLLIDRSDPYLLLGQQSRGSPERTGRLWPHVSTAAPAPRHGSSMLPSGWFRSAGSTASATPTSLPS